MIILYKILNRLPISETILELVISLDLIKYEIF
jgi:hypothetical protein